MNPLIATLPEGALVQTAILAVFLLLAGVVWTGIAGRWRRGEPVIPLARRRPAPWEVQDVLFLFLLGTLLPFLAMWAVGALMGKGGPQPAGAEQTAPNLAHPAEQLLKTGNLAAVAVAVAMAVFVAPLTEEFFFRVLLQGWLEAVWSRRRRTRPEFRRPPRSWGPIVLPAAIFALRHFRSGGSPPAPQLLTGLFLGQMAAEVVTLAVAVVLLRFVAGATAADLGWKPEKLPADARLGLLALLAAVGPVLLIQLAMTKLTTVTGINYSLDAVPLFFLALVFGVLYRRTHRLAPSVILHMTFNLTSVVLFFVS